MKQNNDRCSAFVDYVINECGKDKGFAARMRRGDNPATEYQCWQALGRFGVNLEFDNERIPFALVAASIAKNKSYQTGEMNLGEAIARAYYVKDNKSAPNARLSRLLSCDNTIELCSVLRPMLSLITSRVSQPLDYAQLLRDLVWFERNQERTKARWANSFYRNEIEKKDE